MKNTVTRRRWIIPVAWIVALGISAWGVSMAMGGCGQGSSVAITGPEASSNSVVDIAGGESVSHVSGQVVIRGAWGSGPGEFGFGETPREGPSKLAVSADGSTIAILDWANTRTQLFLLTRVAETKTDDSWPNVRRELERLQVGTFQGSVGFFRKRTTLTAAQKTIFRKLQIPEPPEMQEIQPRAKAS